MTPDEFLFRLKSLPPETAITATHIAAILETMAGGLHKQPALDFDALPQSKLINEETLAEWLGESTSTIQKWRVKGDGPSFVRSPKSVRYAVGAVRDWIASRTVSSTAEAHVKGLSKLMAEHQSQSEDQQAQLNAYPVMLIDGKYVGFFRSLKDDSEKEPDGFKMVRVAALSALHPPKLPKGIEVQAAPIFQALDEFYDLLIIEEPETVRNKYGEWEKRLSDSQRLGYFNISQAYDLDIAAYIGNQFSANYISDNYLPATWLWNALVEYDGGAFPFHTLEYLISLGADINRPSLIEDTSGKVIFEGTIAHLFADTTGEFFHLNTLLDELDTFRPAIFQLLSNGLNVEKPSSDNGGKTAYEIGVEIDEGRGEGASQFKKVIDIFRLTQKLEDNLPNTNISRAQEIDDGKV